MAKKTNNSTGTPDPIKLSNNKSEDGAGLKKDQCIETVTRKKHTNLVCSILGR